MTRRRTSGWYAPWLACLAGALVVADGQSAFATSCVPTPLVTVARQAAAIFEATVSSVTVHPWPEVRHPDGTVSVVAASRRSIVTLRDVIAIRGTAPESIESVERVLEPGRRYLILAMEYPLRPGVLLAGECAGYVRPSARSGGFKAWLESLGEPSTGGRILGSVIARGIGGDVAAWPAVVGARITARGPVTVETVSGAGRPVCVHRIARGQVRGQRDSARRPARSAHTEAFDGDARRGACPVDLGLPRRSGRRRDRRRGR